MFTQISVTMFLLVCLQASLVFGNSNITSPNTNSNNNTVAYKPVNIKEEQTAKKGKSYTIDCTVAPDEKDVDITWKVSDDIIKGPNGKYSFHAADSPKRKSLVINKVEFSDRKEFVCISSYMNVTSTLKVRLRVRDPLGVIWPLIGIFVEIILLFLIIFCYEYKRTSTQHPPITVTTKVGEKKHE